MDARILIGLLRSLARMRAAERLSRADLDAAQAAGLERLRVFACKRSPYYARIHAGLANEPLRALPVLTKRALMEHFDDLVTDRRIRLSDVRAHMSGDRAQSRFLNRYWVNATSGSSGAPAVLLFDRDEWISVLASFARGREWAVGAINLTRQMRMASVASATPWHMSAQASATLNSPWTPALRLAASEPIGEIVERLNAWQPGMLVAYASMARELADEQIARRLRISPQVVFTSSEVLTDEMRRRVSLAWEREPFSQYAATETGGIAAERLSHSGLSIFEDQLIIENVDADNQPVPAGVFGDKVLVTTLFSRTLPLIRYELNDRIRITPEPSPDGHPFARIDAIEGRTEDALYLPGIRGGAVMVHPLVFHRVLDATSAQGWQVRQTPTGIDLLLTGSPDGDVLQRIHQDLTDALRASGATGDIRVVTVPSIPKEISGKTPLIKALRRSNDPA